MLDLSPVPIILGILLGTAFGALAERTHFCTMGALADLALFEDSQRLRAWWLAIAVGLIGYATLTLTGMTTLVQPLYASAPGLLSAGLGGLLFGYGMTRTGGCVSRNLVLLGTGSLKALVVLLIVALAGAMMLDGALASVRTSLDDVVRASPASLDRGALASAAIVVGIGLLGWCLAHQRFRRARREVVAGLGIGLLVTLGWLAAGETSLNPLLGIGALLGGEPEGLGSSAFLIASVAAVPLGAFATARGAGAFRLTGFSDTADLGRHLVGALLMGVGGGLALGCTLGQGMSGVATLALPSLLAMAGLVAGGFAGVRALEHGSLRGAVRARFAGLKG